MKAAFGALFEEGTPDIVPKVINGALLVGQRAPRARPSLARRSHTAPAHATQALMAVLVILYAYFPGVATIHIYVLAFLSLGLMASVNWLLIELKRQPSPLASPGDASDKKVD